MASLRGLIPELREAAALLIAAGQEADSSLRVTSVRRSRAAQARLYRAYIEGRSRLPAAPPGRSMHERGLAFDLARPLINPKEDPLLIELGELWISWGGTWGGAVDPVHFSV